MVRAVMVACLFSMVQDPQGRAVFSSRSELVVIHATVTDRKSGFVAGLPREAFTVYEDGVPQPIGFFENADSPATVGLVIDSSGSMQTRRDSVVAAGMAFALSSHPDDEMFTINFNEKVWPGLPPPQRFTSDRQELREALLRSSSRGLTALFDAIRTALTQLESGHQQKKVLVLVSDGGDNASQTRFSEVLDAALRMNAVIYAIGLFDQYDRDASPRLLRQLAAATGGEAFFPNSPGEVTRVLERIARDIRSGYTIGYAPASARAGYRAIKVEVRPADHRKVAVRARTGYVAGPGADSSARK
jgi:Ca-activated chloride channel homolog